MRVTIITFCLIGAVFANPSQSSESQSLESTSEDTTSEESNSLSTEDDSDALAETRDDSMGSEENVRKSWVRVFASIIKILSTDDNSSTEVKGHSIELTDKQPTGTTFKQKTNNAQGQTNLQQVDNPTDSSDATSESADTSDTTDETQSSSSESDETSEDSDSSDLKQMKSQECVNGTQSCESEEYFFQDIGDDAHYSMDNLIMPDDDERELSLRR
uniref:germ cell nuclear acidic protein-like n=1 Tax=Semicossyphus pulcher TaxID=241346 RepID=UPI0037E78BD9